jgi:hypothetical protein
MVADILLSGITTIDNPTAKNWHIDVTSTNPLGATNQDLKNRTASDTSRTHRSTTRATTSW